ncbi:MANSC domain-containing protein 1 isoform X2 [Rhea pennata]|uniref:MANSC domain-containing protein 1 isoform X2 n=1 Tax=Rhea pennata TaxID=8795 RepID=UPI002E27086D
MSPMRSWYPTYLLVIASLIAAPFQSQECLVKKMENTIININLALSKGVKGTEPVYASTPEACISACCLGEKLSEACPTKPAIGLVSYKITRDTHALEHTSIKNVHSLDVEAFISRSPMNNLNHTTDLQQSDFHPAAALLNHMAKHVDSSEFHTASPEIGGAKHTESLDSTPRQKVENLPPTKVSFTVLTGKPSALLLTTQSGVSELSSTTAAPLPKSVTSSQPTAAELGALTTSTVTFLPRAEPGSPTASVSATHIPLSSPKTSASTATTKWVTTNDSTEPRWRRSATPWVPAAVSSNDTNLLSSSDFSRSSNESPVPFQNNHQGYEPSDSKSYLLEGRLRWEDVVQIGEKSSLVAALLFGVIFLLLVMALTGKKVHESLQKRHYTRLDYLINGTYADV